MEETQDEHIRTKKRGRSRKTRGAHLSRRDVAGGADEVGSRVPCVEQRGAVVLGLQGQVEVEEAAAPWNNCRTILLLLPTGSMRDESELGGMAALLRQGKFGRLLEKIMGEREVEVRRRFRYGHTDLTARQAGLRRPIEGRVRWEEAGHCDGEARRIGSEQEPARWLPRHAPPR
jgi:hypothetical protein